MLDLIYSGNKCWSIPHISLLYCMQLNGVLEETSWEESSASVAAMYPIDDFGYIISLLLPASYARALVSITSTSGMGFCWCR